MRVVYQTRFLRRICDAGKRKTTRVATRRPVTDALHHRCSRLFPLKTANEIFSEKAENRKKSA